MVLPNNIRLELYVATRTFPDRQQYSKSQEALRLIEDKGLDGTIKVIHLDELNRHKEYFDMIGDPEKETRLPFLVYIQGGETSVVLGYSGLEEVTSELNSVGLLK